MFNLSLQRGSPIAEQLVIAVIAAILRGEYTPGQPFPSVRAIATALEIHPNTAHKVIHHLVAENWLEARPGIGTVIGARARETAEEWRSFLQDDVRRLLRRAQSIGAGLPDVIDELSRQWSGSQS